jgi:hypothetical protein
MISNETAKIMNGFCSFCGTSTEPGTTKAGTTKHGTTKPGKIYIRMRPSLERRSWNFYGGIFGQSSLLNPGVKVLNNKYKI